MYRILLHKFITLRSFEQNLHLAKAFCSGYPATASPNVGLRVTERGLRIGFNLMFILESSGKYNEESVGCDADAVTCVRGCGGGSSVGGFPLAAHFF